MENELIKILGKMTYGIYILTTAYKEEVNGMVASWVSQISYDPPLIMVAIHPNRYSHHLIAQSGCFALHLLDRNQTHLIEHFKGPDLVKKFASIPWIRGKTGSPVLKLCLGYMECEVKASYSPGNHTLFVGEITEAQAFSEGQPLSTFDYAGVYIGKE